MIMIVMMAMVIVAILKMNHYSVSKKLVSPHIIMMIMIMMVIIDDDHHDDGVGYYSYIEYKSVYCFKKKKSLTSSDSRSVSYSSLISSGTAGLRKRKSSSENLHWYTGAWPAICKILMPGERKTFASSDITREERADRLEEANCRCLISLRSLLVSSAIEFPILL